MDVCVETQRFVHSCILTHPLIRIPYFLSHLPRIRVYAGLLNIVILHVNGELAVHYPSTEDYPADDKLGRYYINFHVYVYNYTKCINTLVNYIYLRMIKHNNHICACMKIIDIFSANLFCAFTIHCRHEEHWTGVGEEDDAGPYVMSVVRWTDIKGCLKHFARALRLTMSYSSHPACHTDLLCGAVLFALMGLRVASCRPMSSEPRTECCIKEVFKI